MVPDGLPLVQREDLRDPLIVGAERVGEQPPAQPDQYTDQYDDPSLSTLGESPILT